MRQIKYCLTLLCVLFSTVCFADNSDKGSSVSKSGYKLVFSTETPTTASTYLTLSDAEKAKCNGSFSDINALETYWDYCPTWSTVAWTHCMGTTLNQQRANISFDNGTMVLKAKKTSVVEEDGTTTTKFLTSGAQTKSAYQYGIVEIKAKCPNVYTGNFPALWLMPLDESRGWPYDGEIDLMEMINTSYTVYGTIHNGTCKCAEGQSGDYSGTTTGSSAYHIFTLKWTENSITWYLDGKQFYTYSKNSSLSGETADNQWPFDQPFYIIVNQSVGNGGWASAPDESKTYEMDIAYVRVFQQESSYTVSKYFAKGGNIIPSTTSTTAGTEVTLTVNPYSGYELTSLSVIDDSGNAVAVTNNKFTMPAGNVRVLGTFEKSTSPSTGTTFALKTSGSIDTSKKYLIAYKESASATEASLMSSSFTSAATSYARCAPVGETVTISSDQIVTDESNAFTFEGTSGSYYVKNKAGYYIGTSSSNAWFDISNSSGIAHAVSVASTGVATIKCNYNNKTLGYSTSAGGTSGNLGFFYGADKSIYLYEEVSSTPEPTTYTVTCSSASNGTVTASPTSAAAGTEITLTVTPNSGYELNTLTVKDASNNTVTVTNNKFTMPSSNVTVTATFKQSTTPAASGYVTDLSQITDGTIVTIRSQRAFLYYSSSSNYLLGSTATSYTAPEESTSDVNQQFKLISTGTAGQYYLYSVGAGKYITSTGSYGTFTDSTPSVLTVTDASSSSSASVANNYIWYLQIGNYGMNSQDSNQNTYGIVVNSWTTKDKGNIYRFEIVSSEPVVIPTYVLKTSGTIDTNKTYLIAYQESDDATEATLMGSSFTSAETSYARCAPAGETVSINSRQIATSKSNAFTFEGTAGNYYLKNNAGTYIGTTSSNAWFDISTSQEMTHSVAFNGNNVEISCNNNNYVLKYSKSAGGTSGNLGFFYDAAYPVYLYEEVKPCSSFTISEYEWDTFYTNEAFEMPANVTGYLAGIENGRPKLIETYQPGDVVPANTPIVVNGPENTYSINIVESDATAPEGNYLRGMLTAGDITAEPSGSYYYYKVTTGTDSSSSNYGKVGFYWGEQNGGVFTINRDNSAYLVLPQDLNPDKGYAFEDDGKIDIVFLTRLIDALINNTGTGSYYDVNGDREFNKADIEQAAKIILGK